MLAVGRNSDYYSICCVFFFFHLKNGFLTFVLEERGEGIIGGWLLEVSKTSGLSRNLVDGLDDTLETAKILMRRFHNS